MKYLQIIFSPTGGTEKVANAITQNWLQVGTIDLSVPDTNYTDISFESDSLVLISMPSLPGHIMASHIYPIEFFHCQMKKNVLL